MQFLEYLARDRPKQFAKTGLVSQTTAVLCLVIAEPHEQEENDDSDGETILSIASQVCYWQINIHPLLPKMIIAGLMPHKASAEGKLRHAMCNA